MALAPQILPHASNPPAHVHARPVGATLALVLLLLFAPLLTAPTAQGAQIIEPAPDGANAGVTALNLFWSVTREDNFTSGTAEGERDALAANYRLIRTEGYIFPTEQPDTVPLKLFWHTTRSDNFTTATAEGEQAALAVGYRFIRTEGYVYPTQQSGTVPLKLFWHPTRSDNFTTATAEGERSALAVGYRFVRIEGYVFPAQTSFALKLFWSGERGDNFTAITAAGERAALAAGYRFVRTEGRTYASQQAGTVPLKLYYSPARGDNFTTATAAGEQAALNAGYLFIRIEGYLFPTQQPGTVPLKQYYSPAREDNFTTATSEGALDAQNAGYQFIRDEGYLFPAVTPPATPEILLDPPALSINAASGQHITQTLDISNNGTQPLTFSLKVAEASMPAWEPVSFPLSKVAPELEQLQLMSTEPTPFLVYLEDQADLSAAAAISDWGARGQFVYDTLRASAKRSQPALLAVLDQQIAAGTVRSYQPFLLMNAVLVTGTGQAVTALADRLDVAYIDVAQTLSIPQPDPTPDSTPQSVPWGLTTIGADRVWSDLKRRGEGVVVANIDTGVLATHPALRQQYRGTATGSNDFNWFDPTGTFPTAPGDDGNHGTHTMGTMVGDDGQANHIGVAPAAQWIAARACTQTGCSSSDLLAAAEWVLAPYPEGHQELADPQRRPNVVNNSWGGAGGQLFYQFAVQAWRAAGIFPAFSAGNSGQRGAGSVGSPGDYPESFASGATDSADQIAGFSSRGPSSLTPETKPDVSAPGVNVRSAVSNGGTGGYASMQGTSMASPHVAGCVALMLSANPQLSVVELENILTSTAVDLGNPGPDMVYGAGRINCYAAVARAQGVLTWLASPVAAGTVEPSRTNRIELTLDTTNLGPGTYASRIVVASNDPTKPSLIIPVTLVVGGTNSQAIDLFDGVIGTATPQQATTLAADNGQLWADFPVGSATTPITVTYTERATALHRFSGAGQELRSFTLAAQTPNGTALPSAAQTFKLIIPYDRDTLLNANIPASSLALFGWDEPSQQWTPVKLVIEPGNNRIIAYTNRFSEYILVGEQADGLRHVFLPLVLR